MLGYTIDDIDKWQGVLMNVYSMGKCNKKQSEVLKEVKEFFDGLVMEGRV
jgi:hypothetical protein